MGKPYNGSLDCLYGFHHYGNLVGYVGMHRKLPHPLILRYLDACHEV